jgi:uroporphyrinogen-III synthase
MLARATVQWAKPENGALLHAAGARTKGDLAAALTEAGFSVRTEILYEAVAATALPDTGTAEAVLLYSPRGAKVFAALAGRTDDMLAICISAATAEALRPRAFRQILVAEKPDQEALLARLPAPG